MGGAGGEGPEDRSASEVADIGAGELCLPAPIA